MIVRYNRLVAGLMALFCGVNLVLGIWLVLLTRNFNVSLVIGVILIVITVGYWTRPYFHVEANQVVLSALYGPVKRTFPYQSLRIEEGRLLAVSNGIPQRLPIRRWLSHTADWAQLEQRVGSV